MTLPIGGMMMSFTREFTTPPKAAPIITPTARSRTLPRIANALNSWNMGTSGMRCTITAPSIDSQGQTIPRTLVLQQECRQESCIVFLDCRIRRLCLIAVEKFHLEFQVLVEGRGHACAEVG